jgi:CHAT domain-containing protein
MLQAGVNAMLVSQWRISDEATHVLFSEFYRRLLNGTPKVIALHQTIQALRRIHPEWDFYSWGGFVLIGDWK